VIENVLNELTTKDLLHMRVVCREWKVLASRICRQRCVELKAGWCLEGGKTIFGIFDTENLPWSACRFANRNCSSLVWNEHFLNLFGSRLLKLDLSGNAVDILGTLSMTPNLQKLWIPSFNPEMKLIPSAGDKVQRLLPNLKSIRVKTSDDEDGDWKMDVESLETLLKLTNRLDSIQLDDLVLESLEHVQKLRSLLIHIPSVSLNIVHVSDVALYASIPTPNLNIKQLSLPVYMSEIPSSMKMFLSSLKNLESLTMTCLDPSDWSPEKTDFPLMESVKSLKLDITGWHKYEESDPTALSVLTALLSSKFPGLISMCVLATSFHLHGDPIDSVLRSTLTYIFTKVDHLKHFSLVIRSLNHIHESSSTPRDLDMFLGELPSLKNMKGNPLY